MLLKGNNKHCFWNRRDSTLTCEWSEVDVLTLAAGVESNTNHPIGKAIVEAAKSRNCRNIKVSLLLGNDSRPLVATHGLQGCSLFCFIHHFGAGRRRNIHRGTWIGCNGSY